MLGNELKEGNPVPDRYLQIANCQSFEHLTNSGACKVQHSTNTLQIRSDRGVELCGISLTFNEMQIRFECAMTAAVVFANVGRP